MMKKGNVSLLFILIIFVLALPLLFRSNQYGMILLTTILLYGVLATAWNIIGGMAGQLDLAAGAYLGLGAFTTGTLLLRYNLTPWIGIFLGGAVSVAFAILVGLPLFRFKIKEVWYALSSSALVEVLRITFIMWEKVGGPVERYLPDYGSALYMRFSSYLPFYYIMVFLLLASLLVNFWISRSKLGYYLIALGDDEDASEVLGVNVRSSKLKALVIYAFIVGLTGGVYACIYGFIHPNFFSSTMSTEVAILGIVGGMGITYGPLIGAVLLVSMRELLRANLGGQLESLYLVIYSVVLILIVLFRPRGITTLLQEAWAKIFSRWTRKNHAE
jgi:branched-chain amino acid transport system permease protein